jgi:hypothetical protein
MSDENIWEYIPLDGYIELPENLMLELWDSINVPSSDQWTPSMTHLDQLERQWDWSFNNKTYKVNAYYRYTKTDKASFTNTKHSSVKVFDQNDKLVIHIVYVRTPNGDIATLFDYSWKGQTCIPQKDLIYWRLSKKEL